MGVSGSGKSSVGQTLARKLGWDFYDADSFHSATAIEKMRRGIPLNDNDRHPWLKELQSAITRWLQAGKNTVLACSALKSSYRQILYCQHQQVKLIYLQGNFELIFARLKARQHHFMRANLLQTQFDILEEPKSSEAIYIDISQPIQLIVQEIINQLELA
ncbi:MAG: gluconokinase [Symploca sp. SIO3C6]|uniref:Gluconokinase n=1 Tax=Symploca sp. SIO1C4 TaxID=2607765 RepID=A0A6B3N2X3_9CYAN|nr:gluconokinase [Symploca sp. SIO3C6]NER27529.1 gluconokinase [Symploca sp. SIO1C4]NET06212.1 gluconokinase [Symploca sp. SIO2B6]